MSSMIPIFTPFDIISVLWFFGVWVGYNLIADSTWVHQKSVMGIMNAHGSRWMREMIRRDQRMLDAMILNHLQGGIALFASTTILAIGGLVASLGATEAAIDVLASFPLIGGATHLEWEVKMLLMLLIFIYAFFKFAWSYRLYNYCAVLIGAAPRSSEIDEEAEDAAERAAQIANLASHHFNRGLRAFYFALAALSWIIHPVVFMFATASVGMVLYRRDFRSRSRRIVSGGIKISNVLRDS